MQRGRPTARRARWYGALIVMGGVILAAAYLPARPAEAQISLLQAPALIQSIEANDIEEVRSLLVRGSNPNMTFSSVPALITAVDVGNPNIVALMLEFGAWTHPSDDLGNTPLLLAADLGRDRSAQILLDAGADPNSANRQGITPLMAAVRSGHLLIVETLLAAGADPNATDYTGRTVLGWAEGVRVRGIRDRLVAAGAE